MVTKTATTAVNMEATKRHEMLPSSKKDSRNRTLGKRKRDALINTTQTSSKFLCQTSQKARSVHVKVSDDEAPSIDGDDDDVSLQEENHSNDNLMDRYSRNRHGSSISICKSWEERFQLLVEYKNKHGTTRVPQLEVPLGPWVNKQRAKYKAHTLSRNRYQRLNSIGFEWNIQSSIWMEMYNQLCSYQTQHNGSTHIPTSCEEYKSLRNWVYKQRRSYSMGTLSVERINLLNKIKFKLPQRTGLDWMEMFERLVVYQKKHNSTRVPINFKDRQLARWVQKQRKECRKEYHTELLNSIGFEWNPLKEAWMETYRRLVAYKAKHGNTCVPYIFEEDPALGNWVHRQRHSCNEIDRINLLNAIGFEWNSPKEAWMRMYRRLVAHKAKNGSTCVSFNFQEDPSLGKWVHRQRHSCKESYRINLLNKIGFVWKIRDRKTGSKPKID